MPKSTVAGSHGKCMFNFKETTKLYIEVTVLFYSHVYLKHMLNKKTPLLLDISHDIYYVYFK